MIWPLKPKLDPRNGEELRLYATDDLRHLYQTPEHGSLIRLRDGIVSRDELKAVILWRVWWQGFGYSLLLLVSAIGAVAAVIAAVEGWHPHA